MVATHIVLSVLTSFNVALLYIFTLLKALVSASGTHFEALPYSKTTATSLLGQKAAKLKTAPRTSASSI